MSDVLVKRLRDHAEYFGVNHVPNICDAAADRIEQLQDMAEVMQHQLKELQWSFDCKDDLHQQDYDRMKKYADRIEQLEAALREIAEGDIPRTVKVPFRDDGQPSKNDRCEHGQWMYEECGCCIEDYARAALGEKKDD